MRRVLEYLGILREPGAPKPWSRGWWLGTVLPVLVAIVVMVLIL